MNVVINNKKSIKFENKTKNKRKGRKYIDKKIKLEQQLKIAQKIQINIKKMTKNNIYKVKW